MTCNQLFLFLFIVNKINNFAITFLKFGLLLNNNFSWIKIIQIIIIIIIFIKYLKKMDIH